VGPQDEQCVVAGRAVCGGRKKAVWGSKMSSAQWAHNALCPIDESTQEHL